MNIQYNCIVVQSLFRLKDILKRNNMFQNVDFLSMIWCLNEVFIKCSVKGSRLAGCRKNMLNVAAHPLYLVKVILQSVISSGGDAGENQIYMLIFFSNFLGGEHYSN